MSMELRVEQRREFHWAEQLEQEFYLATGVPPSLYAEGPREMLARVREYCRGTALESSIASVSLDPTASLVYACAVDELRATSLKNGMEASLDDIATLALEFGLPEESLYEPVWRLSGGERVLLALARAFSAEPSTSGLSVASPMRWLSRAHGEKVTRVAARFKAAGKPVHWYLMGGESLPGQEASGARNAPDVPHLEFEISISDLEVQMEAESFPNPTRRLLLRFRTPHLKPVPFVSPVLLMAPNGQGKSTLASLLSGTVRPSSGHFRVTPLKANRHVRAMMQAATHQLLGKGASRYLSWAMRESKGAQQKAKTEYESLLARVQEIAQSLGEDPAEVHTPRDGAVLRGKVSVLTARLMSEPTLLILDEPGMGLCVNVATALVAATCEAAARLAIPVILISHEERWWAPLAGSLATLKPEVRTSGWDAEWNVELVRTM